MMQVTSPLAEKMVRRADKDGLPEGHELRVKAKELDAAITNPNFDARKMLGCWARARKAWTTYTGEPLI